MEYSKEEQEYRESLIEQIEAVLGRLSDYRTPDLKVVK